MVSEDIRCVLVKIHGIGRQGPAWSSDFDAALDGRLATLSPSQRSAVKNESVRWSDLSTLPGAGAPAAIRDDTAPVGPAETAYAATSADYTRYLTVSAATVPGAAADLDSIIRGVSSRIFGLRDGALTLADHVNDVANYVSNNAVRLAVQRRLSDRLFAVHGAYPNAPIILGSHSQGTIIAFDVLRLCGDQLPQLTTWVTMGSPLQWYLTFGRWGSGQLGIQPTLTWVNYYDRADTVGKALAGLVPWQAPQPQDTNVNNTGADLDAHDHWHNPRVVDGYFELIRQAVT